MTNPVIKSTITLELDKLYPEWLVALRPEFTCIVNDVIDIPPIVVAVYRYNKQTGPHQFLYSYEGIRIKSYVGGTRQKSVTKQDLTPILHSARYLSINHIIPRYELVRFVGDINDLKLRIKHQMSHEIGHQVIEELPTTETVDARDGDTRLNLSLYALTLNELQELLIRAYEVGLQAKGH
jgi:hypothetical protein